MGQVVEAQCRRLSRLSGKASWSRQLLDGGLQVSHSGEEGIGAPFRELTNWVLMMKALRCVI